MQTKKRFFGPASLIATLGAGLMLTGCGLVPVGLANTEGPQDNEGVETPVADPPTDNTSEGPDPVESESAAPGSEPQWLPASGTEWTNSYDPDSNMHQAMLDGTGCDIILRQESGAEQAQQSGQEPMDTVDRFFDSVAEQEGTTQVEESTDPYEVMAESGEMYEFETRKVSFDTPEFNRTLRTGTQWIGDSELIISSSCPTDEWDDAQLSMAFFLTATSIDQA